MSNQREEEILRRRERIKKSKERRRRKPEQEDGREKKQTEADRSRCLDCPDYGGRRGPAIRWSWETPRRKRKYGPTKRSIMGKMSYFPRDLRLPISVFPRMIKMRSAMNGSTDVHAAGLFDVDGASVRYS